MGVWRLVDNVWGLLAEPTVKTARRPRKNNSWVLHRRFCFCSPLYSVCKNARQRSLLAVLLWTVRFTGGHSQSSDSTLPLPRASSPLTPTTFTSSCHRIHSSSRRLFQPQHPSTETLTQHYLLCTHPNLMWSFRCQKDWCRGNTASNEAPNNKRLETIKECLRNCNKSQRMKPQNKQRSISLF